MARSSCILSGTEKTHNRMQRSRKKQNETKPSETKQNREKIAMASSPNTLLWKANIFGVRKQKVEFLSQNIS